MRTIDADAFTEFLKDAIKQQKYEDTKIDGLLTVADVIEAVISELDGTSLVGFKNAPTIEPQPHWIPCSEKLPEYRKLVDVTTRGLRVKLAYLDSIEEDGTDDLWIIPLEDAECALWNVVAWKPRPEPWKGEDDEALHKAAESERPSGKWLSHYDYCKRHGYIPSGMMAFWWCDQCEQGVDHTTKFCPHCGAKMLREDNK